MHPGNHLQRSTGKGHACPRALRHMGVGSLNHQLAAISVPRLPRGYLIIGVGFQPAEDSLGEALRNFPMV